jgi:hypothetical protein
MKKCVYCGKKPLPKGQRKYCNGDCAEKYKQFGPAREQYVYHKGENTHSEMLGMLNEGAWFAVTRDQTDEQCIADFIRVWKRPPDHVIWVPEYPMMKFAGPVWDEEELKRRWIE